MRCSNVMRILENLAPLSYAEEWDNVGLLAGRRDKTVHRVMIALDATDDVIEQAILQQADMLITHHPLLFRGIKRLTEEDFIGRRLRKLIRNDICYYAMHTNFDVAKMAKAAARACRLLDCEVLEASLWNENVPEGIGCIGKLPREMTVEECAEVCKKAFSLDHIRIYGNKERLVETAAIVPGSGKDYIAAALKKEADVFITGDIGHHDGLDAMEQGLVIMDAGHYGLEKLFVPYLAEAFEQQMPELSVYQAKETSPFYIQ